LRGDAYVRLMRGVYSQAGPVTHGDMIAAARLVLPADAVLAGRSAAWALGARLATGSDSVELLVPRPTTARRPQLVLRTDTLDTDETTVTALGLTTTAARTAFDLARWCSPLVAVPLLDALVRATGLLRRDVESVGARHPGVRGCRRVASTLDLVDAGAESPRESVLRVTLALAGLPPPVTQLSVYNDEGMFVARPDLAWPEARVAVEYDGAHHDDPAWIARDRARLNALRMAGWTVLVVDRAQMRHPAQVVEMIRRALHQASTGK
jgi:hypothetical protein